MTEFRDQGKGKISRIEEQAAEWLSMVIDGNANEITKIAHQKWLDSSEEHRRAYKDMEILWCEIEGINPQLPETGPNISAANSFPISKRLLQPLIGIAAAILLVGVIILISPQKNSKYTTYSTAVGEIKTFLLSDGSKVTLSAASKIAFTESEKLRQLRVDSGQIYFDIFSKTLINNEKIPFEIEIENLKIEVVGTQFDVHKLENHVYVTVTEGAVKIGTKDSIEHADTLVPGQQIVALGPQYDDIRKPEVVDIDGVTSWRKGRLTYRDAPLSEIISDAERFYGNNITLGDESLKMLRVTTSFRVDQVSEMTKMLEDVLPVRVYLESNNNILILPQHNY